MRRGNYPVGLTSTPSLSIDVKIRLGLLLVSVAVSAIAAIAAAHGLYVGFLDEIGGGGPL